MNTIQTNKMESLRALLQQTTESLAAAGKLIVEMINEDATNYDRIKAEFGFSDYVMERLQNIGLGRLNPQLALDNSAAAHYIERLPRAQQDKVINEGVPVVVSVENGRPQVEMIPYRKLSGEKAKAAFDGNTIRPVEAQAKKFTEKTIVSLPQPAPPAYERVGDKVFFRQGAMVTLSELEALCEKFRNELVSELQATLKGKQVSNN